MLLESFCHPESIFVTLTYSNEYLPESGSVSKRDVQLFLKRLRKAHQSPIRYFAVGEYGSRTYRPHYHLAIFGMGRADTPAISKAWPYGFIQVGDLTPESADYVVGYIAKGITSTRNWSHYVSQHGELNGKEPEFAIMSRKPAIGTGALQTIGESIVHYFPHEPIGDESDIPKEFRIGNRRYPLGRTLSGKLRLAFGCPGGGEPDHLRQLRHQALISKAIEETVSAWKLRDAQRRRASAIKAQARHKLNQFKRNL